ncbi:MAG: PVC-type heme-binding CxxCH protein, partial [Opitutaceae bacterium]
EQTVTSFGDVFQNDNDDPPACRTTFLLEYGNAGFFSRDGKRTWRADKRPGQSIPTAEWRQEDPGTMPSGDVYGAGAPTGIVFHEGDALGEKWRGLLLSGESARNTVFGYLPKPDGAGFTLERFDFLTSNREGQFAGTDILRGKVSEELKTFFRPSDVAVGPDGAIYVSDWFDPRVGGHQDLDDGTTGAIYRIAPKGFRSRIPQLNLDTVEGQLSAVKSPAVNVRALGFTKLVEGGENSVDAVARLLDDANPYIRARGVWLLSRLGDQGLARIEKILTGAGADEQMRVAAFRALRRVNHRVLDHAARLATDPSLALRREVALAMRDVPLEAAREILLNLARSFDGKDRTYLEAWGIGCSGKEAEMYRALAALSPDADPVKWKPAFAQLVWRLTPEAAAPAFAARAGASSLSESERLAAVTALGFLESDAAPKTLLDLAENARGMVERHALWWLLNYRKTRWSSYPVDAELKSRGLYDPDAITVVPSMVPEPAPRTLPAPEEIAALEASVKRGAEKVQSCFLCHRLGDEGIDYAPNLTGWASRQTTEVAIEAIVDPSAAIAHGFDGHELVMQDGTVVHGIVESSEDPLVVRSMGGVTQLIPEAKVKENKRLGRSLMLSAEQLGLSAQDVADIVGYLRSLGTDEAQ